MIKTQKAYYYIIRDLIPLTRITDLQVQYKKGV